MDASSIHAMQSLGCHNKDTVLSVSHETACVTDIRYSTGTVSHGATRVAQLKLFSGEGEDDT